MSILFHSVAEGGAAASSYLICLLIACLCGCITAFAASYRTQISKSFMVSLVVLPMIIDTVIVMVNGNIGTGVAVMGAFSLVRFRSVPGKAKDIALIFLAMTAGLSCAAGYVGVALVLTLTVCVIMMLLSHVPLGIERAVALHITVPESLRFSHEFDDLFEKYTRKYQLSKVKTTNMGSLFKLEYRIEMKSPDRVQDFIDELRCRNGNLEIAVMEISEGEGEL